MLSAAPATHSPEWWAERNTGIGASESATVAGVGRWGSRYTLWLEKTGQLAPDPDEGTEAQRMGLRLEPTLARFFAEDTGLHVVGEQMMVRRPTIPWVRATVDVLAAESPESSIDDVLGPVQLKHTNDSPWDGPDGIPVYYRCQGQWEMLAGGWERMWFAVLHSFGRFRVYEVERDVEAQDALLAAGSDFWHGHVLAGVAPDLGGGNRADTSAALAAVFGEGGAGEIDVEDLAEQLASIRWLKRERKSLDEQIVDLENVVKATLGDSEVGLINGRPAVTWKRSRPRRFDSTRHKTEAPDCAEQFTVEGSQRTLLIKGGTE